MKTLFAAATLAATLCLGLASAQEPTAPTSLRLTAGDSRLTATWTAATSAPDGYLARIRLRGSNRIMNSQVVRGTQATFSGLQNEVDHIVVVDTNFGPGNALKSPRKFVSRIGRPMRSETVDPPTPPSEPTAPTSLRLTAGDSRLTATWTAATSAPNGYLARIRLRGSNRIMNSQVVRGTQATFSGLQNEVDHIVVVDTNFGPGNALKSPRKFVSRIGRPMRSETVDPPTPPSEPTAPTSLRLTAGDSRLTATWTAATSAPNGYLARIRLRGSNRIMNSQVVRGTQATFSGLQNGVDYIVLVDTNFGPGNVIKSPRRYITNVGRLGTASVDDGLPNIVVVLADDLGYADVGFQGSEWATPHIDALRESGLRFSNGYVSHSGCGPSRAGLLSGRYQQSFGFQGNPSWTQNHGIPTDVVLLPSMLNQAGYVSAIVGKWHLGRPTFAHPFNKGFDRFYGFLGGGHDYWKTDQRDNSESGSKLHDDNDRVHLTKYLTTQLTDAAVEFIDDNSTRPFFLYLAYNAPHSPAQAPAEAIQRVSSIEDETERIYAAMITVMDDEIGRVRTKLETLELTENTIFIFLSDHGAARDSGGRNLPLRGYKGTLYDGALKVPFVMSWPDKIEADTTYDLPVSSLDIVPTVLKAAGLSPPSNLDGVDLMPYLDGTFTTRPHKRLYFSRPNGVHFAMRQNDFKLVRTKASSASAALFNLAEDVGERHNIARDNPIEKADMIDRVVAWYASHPAKLW